MTSLPLILAESLEALADPVILIDQRKTIIHFNKAASEAWPALATGAPLSFTLRAPDLVEAIEEVLADRMRECEGIFSERHPVERDFSFRIRGLQETESYSARTAPAALVILRDLTEARRLESMRVDFVANASHELRTPLNAILGFSEIMEAELLGRHRVKAYRAYARDIHESGRMLLGLIDELLDLSRIEAGRFDLVESEISLADIAADCAHLVELRAQSRDLSLLLMVDPALSLVRADPRAIRQIILNLLSNAIKFTPEGGEITIEIGATKSGGQFIKVADTGPGIPAFEIPIILESFGRGSLAIKSAKEGAGLGLPIVRGLTSMHGGEFSINSREGEGTSVTITLPETRVIATLKKEQPRDTKERAAA